MAWNDLFDHSFLVAWDSEYELGIPIVDEQHRAIVAIINSLHCAMRNGFDEHMLEPAIGMAKEYAHVHFRTEEYFFEKYEFPDAGRHRALHDELVHTMFEVGQESVFNQDPDQFVQFLKNWLLEHILGKDRLFRDYLLEMRNKHAEGA